MTPCAWQMAGDHEGAAKAFQFCVDKAATDDQRDLCKSLKEQQAK